MHMFRKIQPDKWKHFWVGIPMGAFLQWISEMILPGLLQPTIIASIAVAAISYGFELFSKITGIGHYDFGDAVASVIGGVLGMGIVLLV